MTVVVLRLISPDSPAAYAESTIPEAIPFNAPTSPDTGPRVDALQFLFGRSQRID